MAMLHIKLDFVCEEINKRRGLIISRTKHIVPCSIKWNLSSADIAQAFSYGELDVPLYCYPPPGYVCPAGKVLKLNNALYGCVQAHAQLKKCSTRNLVQETER